MITWIHFDVKKFWSLGLYLIFSFLRFAVTYRRWKCICFSIFRGLQSLPGAEFVSAFLLFAICSHFSPPEVYPIFSFSWFTVTLENWELSFFLLFPICSHFGNPGVYLFFSFWRFAVTLGFMSVSAFYFFAICSHFWYLGLYLIFSFSRFAVTF